MHSSNRLNLSSLSLEENQANPSSLHVAEDLVLVKIPPGKKYITEDFSRNQQAQKGPTCGYYVFNLFRPRIGKTTHLNSILEQHPEMRNDVDVQQLLEVRRVEKIISKGRKELMQAWEQYKLYCDIVAEAGSNTITKTQAMLACEARKKFYKMSITQVDLAMIMKGTLCEPLKSMPFPDYQKRLLTEIKFLTCFAEQNQVDKLVEFPMHFYLNRRIEIVKKTLNELGCDIENEIEKFVQMSNSVCNTMVSDRNIEHLSLDQQCIVYRCILTIAMASRYFLKPTTWSPEGDLNDSLELLKNALKTEGSISVFATLGRVFYKDEPRMGRKLIDAYQIFSWPRGSVKETNINNSTHALLIVGVETLQTLKGKQNTIFYIDPTDESKPTEARRVYQTSYDTLIKNTFNVLGLKGFAGNVPFGYFSDPTFARELQNKYKNIVERAASLNTTKMASLRN